MTRVAFVLAFLAVASLASAQAPNIASYQLNVFAPGVSVTTGSPVSTTTYLAAAALCNQTPPVVPPTVVNPGHFAFDDQANPGKSCIVPLVSTLLPGLPNGVGYETTLTQTDNIGQVSPGSAASNPFNRQGLPAVLTGLHLIG
jgi:hypothetical protein